MIAILDGAVEKPHHIKEDIRNQILNTGRNSLNLPQQDSNLYHQGFEEDIIDEKVCKIVFKAVPFKLYKKYDMHLKIIVLAISKQQQKELMFANE